MQTIHSKYITNTPFRITTESVENRPGTWNSTKVSIYRDNLYDLKNDTYRDGKLIGEYLRNYSNFGHETFCPFQVGDQWYALYSANYTATRVMKLHEDRIEDWCGEQPSATGFCPVEFYVPRVIRTRSEIDRGIGSSYNDMFYADCDYPNEEFFNLMGDPDFFDIEYCNFGLVAGCVWGDDSSWKLRFIDLSQIPDKILTITEKFGYWELSDELSLKKSIRMDGWEPNHNWIRLVRSESFNYKTNERC